MSAMLLTAEQNEVLQEIANIGMGRAGRSLAGVFEEFVELSVPRVREAGLDELPGAVAQLIPDETLTAVRQAFFG
ncbi:MAG TPA: chemotaxis protein CheC, partial [Methyloversatilis sp.]